MKVIILCGGRFSSYDQASAAAKVGVLHKFITARFDARDKRIPIHLVKSISGPAYFGAVWRRIPFLKKVIPYNRISDNLFDLLAKQYIESCDLIHSWSQYCLYSHRRARMLGVKKSIVHRGSAHPHTRQRILTEEWARFGFTYPRVAEALVEKQLREYEEADYVMVPSDFAYRSMIEEGVPAAKLIMLPYGANLEAFEPNAKPDNTFRVLFAGMLSFQKGIYYLLEAWQQLALPDAQLVLAGSFRDNFRPTFAKYADSVTYLGWVDYWQIRAEYARASVFVLPSLQEGSAKVVYEAMACARPVIVTTNCGSVARDGIDGFIIQPRDIEALQEKLLYFYENRDAIHRMGQAARERALEFSTERYGKELIEIYRRILTGGDLGLWRPSL